MVDKVNQSLQEKEQSHKVRKHHTKTDNLLRNSIWCQHVTEPDKF